MAVQDNNLLYEIQNVNNILKMMNGLGTEYQPYNLGPTMDMFDDIVPSHRRQQFGNSDFFKIGDVVLQIPPQSISVSRNVDVDTTPILRQSSGIATKGGTSNTVISINLTFNDIEQINGVKIESPFYQKGNEDYYYMDGLRALIAQFKRTPILPVVSKYLNENFEVFNVTLDRLLISTSKDFPDVIDVNILLRKTTLEPYIGLPDMDFHDMICYPIFRWYYQQLLRDKSPSYNKLEKIHTFNFTGDIKFKLLHVDRVKEENNIDMVDNYFVEVPFDYNNLFVQNIEVSIENIFSDLQFSLYECPSHQFLGSLNENISISIEIKGDHNLQVFNHMIDTLQYYTRFDKSIRALTGYLKIENEILNLCGIRYAILKNYSVQTEEGFPGTYHIKLDLLGFKRNQKLIEKPSEINYLPAILGKKSLETIDISDNKNIIIYPVLVEQNLRGVEVYPDLELPTYKELFDAVAKINEQRKKHNLSPIKLTLKSQYPTVERVDPDFYVFYPSNDWLPSTVDIASLGKPTTAYEDVSITFVSPSGQSYGIADTDLKQLRNIVPTDKKKLLAYLKKKGADKIFIDQLDNFMKLEQLTGISAMFWIALAGHEAGWYVSPKHRKYKNLYSYGMLGSGQILGKENEWSATMYKKYKVDSVTQKKDTYHVVGLGLKIYDQYYLTNKMITISKMGPTYCGDGYEGWIKGISSLVKEMMEYTIGHDISFDQQQESIKNISLELYKHLPNFKTIDITQAKYDLVVPYRSKMPILSADALAVWSFHDMVKYSARGRFVQAFPGFCIILIDEAPFIGKYRLWTRYFDTHAVSRISIVKDRKNPTDVAFLEITNVYGLYSKVYKTRHRDVGLLKQAKELFVPEIPEEAIKIRQMTLDGFYIRPGIRIQIRLGYTANAYNMNIVFNGVITEVDNTDSIEIVAQSDGVELTNVMARYGPNDETGVLNYGMEASNIVRNMLGMRNSWYAINPNWGNQSPLSIVHFGEVFRLQDSSNSWIGKLFGTLQGFLFQNYDIYEVAKNVYTANDNPYEYSYGKETNFWTQLKELFEIDFELNFKVNLYQQTPWDIFNVVARTWPGYIVAVHPHNFRSTLFFGDPSFLIKYGYDFRPGWEKEFVKALTNKEAQDKFIKNYVVEKIKPFSQVHIYDSFGNILGNTIRASSELLIHNCTVTYSVSGELKVSSLIQADKYIKSDLQRTQIITTNVIQDFVGWDKANQYLGFSIERTVVRNIGISHIRDSFKDMYQDDLIVIGDPSVKPYDFMMINDITLKMSGPAGVGKVVHNFGFDTGFITAIKPDLVVFEKTACIPTIITRWMSLGLSYLAYLGLRGSIIRSLKQFGAFAKTAPKVIGQSNIFKSGMAIASKLKNMIPFVKDIKFASKLKESATAVKVINEARSIISKAGAVASATLTPTIIGTIISLASTVIIDMTLSKVIDFIVGYFENTNVINILPLFIEDKPYVAGIDGYRQLIPGMPDPWYYGESDYVAGENISFEEFGQQQLPMAKYREAMSPQYIAQVYKGYNAVTARPKYIKGSAVSPAIEYLAIAGTDPSFLSQTGQNIKDVVKTITTKGIRAIIDPNSPDMFVSMLFPTVGKISSLCGFRKLGGKLEFHDGIDIAAEIGTPVVATAYGKVVFAGTLNGFGNTIIIYHEEVGQTYTLYGHLSSISVKKGQVVYAGQVIGKVGNTGRSTGPHLHFSIYTNTRISNDMVRPPLIDAIKVKGMLVAGSYRYIINPYYMLPFIHDQATTDLIKKEQSKFWA